MLEILSYSQGKEKRCESKLNSIAGLFISAVQKVLLLCSDSLPSDIEEGVGGGTPSEVRWIVGTKSHKGLTTAFDFLPFHIKQVPKAIMTSPMLGETIRHGLIYHPPPSVGHQRRFWNLRANLWFPCLWLPLPSLCFGYRSGEGSCGAAHLSCAITRELGSSFLGSKDKDSRGSGCRPRAQRPVRSPPPWGRAASSSSPGPPGQLPAASAWSYSDGSGTRFSLASRWAWGSWPGAPFQVLTGTSGGWTSSLTRWPVCGRKRLESAFGAAWGCVGGLGGPLKCVHSPADKSPRA